MVIAGENVLDAELDEVEPARRDSAVDVHVTDLNSSPKITCRSPLGVRRLPRVW